MTTKQISVRLFTDTTNISSFRVLLDNTQAISLHHTSHHRQNYIWDLIQQQLGTPLMQCLYLLLIVYT